MSEEQKRKKSLDEIEAAKLSPYDKTPVSFPVRITADQRAKVIRLCEATVAINEIDDMNNNYFRCPICWEDIHYRRSITNNSMEEITHKSDCAYLLAKQLLEELKG